MNRALAYSFLEAIRHGCYRANSLESSQTLREVASALQTEIDRTMGSCSSDWADSEYPKPPSRFRPDRLEELYK